MPINLFDGARGPRRAEMALKAVIQKLQDVPEAQRSFYSEGEDGKFHLDAEGIEDVSGLKSALEAERKERRKHERALAAFKDVDPERYNALLRAEEEREAVKAKASGDWEKREAQLIEKHGREIKSKEESLVAAQRTVERALIDAEAARAIAAAKGSVRLLLPEIKQRVKVLKGQDGEFAIRVVDAEGTPRIGKVEGGKAAPMTIAELVAELREDAELARAFDGSGASGSGAAKSEGGGGAVRTIPAGDDKAFLANLEKIAKGEVAVT